MLSGDMMQCELIRDSKLLCFIVQQVDNKDRDMVVVTTQEAKWLTTQVGSNSLDSNSLASSPVNTLPLVNSSSKLIPMALQLVKIALTTKVWAS